MNAPRAAKAATTGKSSVSGAAETEVADAAKLLKVPEFYRPDDYKPDESVGYLMRRILNMVASEAELQLEPTGLTNAQWVPLFKLYMGSASTVAELSRVCSLDTGGMTRLLDRLEAKGLVRRVRSSEDRRVVNLELTPEGREVAQGIPAVLCGVQNAHMRGFTTEEWQLLKSMLRRILDNALAIQADREGQK
jgi:DNA-binding MarR family transcriptional regulator